MVRLSSRLADIRDSFERVMTTCAFNGLREPATELVMNIGSVGGSPAKSWLRAIELTSQIDSDPRRLFADVVDDWAKKQPQHSALISENESSNYRAASNRIHRYARGALSVEITPGELV